MRVLGCLAVVVLSLQGAEPDRYIGAETCRPCHPAEFIAQRASAHAAALSPVSPGASFSENKISRPPRYRYEILRVQNGLRVHIDNGADLMDLPLEWAFGAARQAVTFITRVNQEWYIEHYASWYTATKSYGPTPGQGDLHPKNMQEAAGVLYKISDPQFGVKGCFECHSTGPVSFDKKGEVHLTENGVGCESCHGPGSEHAADPRRHRLVNPGQLSAPQLNDFCGRCHRMTAGRNVTIDWNFAWNVRHQPVYLSQSRCFLQSAGKLSCLTCHSPHEAAAAKPAAFFNDKCLQCHSGCAIKSRTNCIDCHMPLVSPQSPLRFTNHWIGIYSTGAKLKPIR
jgi:hypothetical protein